MSVETELQIYATLLPNPFYYAKIKNFLFVVMGMCISRWIYGNIYERKNRDFKYEYLSQYKDKSLNGMLTVLTEKFLPDKQCTTLIPQ